MVAWLALALQMVVLLAPADLVLCIELGGHVSLEMAGRTCCLTQDFGSRACDSGRGPRELGTPADSDGCTDLILGSSAPKVVPAAMDRLCPPQPATPVGAASAALPDGCPQGSSRRALWVASGGTRSSPLRELATVVLRC